MDDPVLALGAHLL